ncbi:alpha/beta fold hydrolase [Flavobacterium yafengii]|uniref:alpha/beta fold hydrolase n=1 Tax=Flavobacterium yafengii TaxID=3041253 RepID=UPI0024A9EA35|nr:alpha/beta hydrolase [Flavobacterium yafengii]MDI5899049.1 alpha/beta hydrolase [Flavobacterium yafengii]
MKEHTIAKIIQVDYKNIYVEYYHTFDGCPTIIFLHDSLGCVTLWRDFPKKLSEATKCNVLVYDRLGYGKSDAMPTHKRPVNYLELEADFLGKLLIQLHVKDAILFGHSDGGSIALITAAKYPDRIKAIICEAAHIFVEEVTLRGIYEAMDSYKKTNLAERLAKYHGDKVECIFKAWTETWTSADYKVWNIEYLLKEITCPLLFIQGEADEYGTLNQVNRTINRVRGKTEKLVIPNIGHTPHKEAPETTFEAAKDFIVKME